MSMLGSVNACLRYRLRAMCVLAADEVMAVSTLKPYSELLALQLDLGLFGHLGSEAHNLVLHDLLVWASARSDHSGPLGTDHRPLPVTVSPLGLTVRWPLLTSGCECFKRLALPRSEYCVCLSTACCGMSCSHAPFRVALC